MGEIYGIVILGGIGLFPGFHHASAIASKARHQASLIAHPRVSCNCTAIGFTCSVFLNLPLERFLNKVRITADRAFNWPGYIGGQSGIYFISIFMGKINACKCEQWINFVCLFINVLLIRNKYLYGWVITMALYRFPECHVIYFKKDTKKCMTEARKHPYDLIVVPRCSS
jgi:hypothetical protein